MQTLNDLLKRIPFLRALVRRRRPAPPPPRQVNLQEIEALSLPRNTKFIEQSGVVQEVEGMLSPFSIAIMDMLLSFQNEVGASGNMLEIGTYKGKSAALLGCHLKSGERLALVDIAEYLEPRAIESFRDQVEFILSDSAQLRKNMPGYRGKLQSFRFIHIDASHGYDETYHEMGLANELLARRGIIALDDFTNLNYSQNIAAIFKYLHTAGSDLVMLLVTDEKGYVCHKQDFDVYADLLLRRSTAELKSRDIDAVFARTSNTSEYRAPYLRYRNPSEEGAFYGVEIYSRHIANG